MNHIDTTDWDDWIKSGSGEARAIYLQVLEMRQQTIVLKSIAMSLAALASAHASSVFDDGGDEDDV